MAKMMKTRIAFENNGIINLATPSYNLVTISGYWNYGGGIIRGWIDFDGMGRLRKPKKSST